MMRILRRIVPVLLVSAFLTTAVVAPAAAAPAKPAPISIDEDVTLSLPWGDVELSNAKLDVETAEDGSIERLRGTVDMPFPTFGVLDDTRIISPARADIGLELGENLAELNLGLEPDRKYLFFNVDTAFGVNARVPGSGNELAFSLEPGQQLTLVVDTTEPTAYLDGQITLSLDDQVALLGGILESTAIGEYVPDSLPIRERTQFEVSGKFSRKLAESYLILSGAYVMDGGLLPTRLGIQAEPIKVKGTLTLNRDGVLADGVAVSSIQPEVIYDSGARFQAFIPFREEAGEAFATLEGKVISPAAKLAADAGTEIGEAGYELRGKLDTPFSPTDLVGEASGKINMPDLTGARSVLSKAASVVIGFAQQGVELAGDAVDAGKIRLYRSGEPATD